MRVLSLGLVYPPHLLGGHEVVWQGVTRRLLADGHASDVLVSDFRAPEVAAGAPEDPGVHRELRSYWRDHAWPRLGPRATLALERHNAAVLERHLRAFRPDVVALWPMGGLSLSLITAIQRAGLPSVFFVHDPWPTYGPRHDRWLATWSRWFMRPLAWPGQRLTGLPTALDLIPGRWLPNSGWMAAHAGVDWDPAQVRVLSPGIESRFLDAPVEAPAPWRWRLLYLGRVVEQKGVIDAVEALAHLPPEASLCVVGSGDAEYRAALERRARELAVWDRVHLRPPVDRAATLALYRDADVVLHPVRWNEPWGLVPLEAMALGRPVVATGTGGSADFLADDVNALLHPPADATALAAAARRLAGDPALRARLVAAGRSTAEAHSAEAFEREAVAELLAAAQTGP